MANGERDGDLFAFTSPDDVSQDFITTDESYDEIKRIIAYQRVERGKSE